MADDGTALVVVAMMTCFFSVVLSGFSYTCTGGSFDPEDFDGDKCLTLFPEDDDDSGGGGGGGGSDGGGVSNPSNLPSTPGGACEYFSQDVTTTCYSSSGGEAGVRWGWLDSDDATACKEKTTKYGIVVSSSETNHNVKYKFPDVVGRDSNSFKFNGAPSGFLTGQNVKFEITPLNDSNEKVGNTVIATLDTNNSREACNAHGTAVPFSSATSLGAVGSQPTLDPQDCQGNTYTPPSACMRDGVVLDGTPSRCGHGKINWALDTNAADYVAAKDGGSCTLSHSRVCEVPCPPDAPPPPDCNSYVTDFLRNDTLGCVADDFDHNNPPSSASAYTKYTDHYPAGGKDGVIQWYKIASDPTNCKKLTEWRACGYTEEPVNCVGNWVNDGGEYTTYGPCNCPHKTKYTKQNKKYHVSDEGNATGAACETFHGDTKIVDIETKSVRCCH